ncbi:MAG: hypothetical protein KGD59_01180 [Candidatus Heimdallarchaeota archaeon]|nr:hypothetical protein [Candidatus Heimdallarchaeota archaeon]MBY8993132.1 hypothetical protein [Candidatus Heimdallarchaeota archaeon]
MAAEKKDKKKSPEKSKETINPNSMDLLSDKLDQTIQRIAELENKIEKLSPDIKDATGSLNMTLAILRTFQEVTNVATIFSPSKWLMRLRPDVSLDAIERLIVDVLTREGPKNISQLTASVRMERGTASRRIIRDKVNDMIVREILEDVDEGYGRVIKMAIDVKNLS